MYAPPTYWQDDCSEIKPRPQFCSKLDKLEKMKVQPTLAAPAGQNRRLRVLTLCSFGLLFEDSWCSCSHTVSLFNTNGRISNSEVASMKLVHLAHRETKQGCEDFDLFGGRKAFFFFNKVTVIKATLRRWDSAPPYGQFNRRNYWKVFPSEVINGQTANQILIPGEIIAQNCSHNLGLSTQSSNGGATNFGGPCWPQPQNAVFGT